MEGSSERRGARPGGTAGRRGSGKHPLHELLERNRETLKNEKSEKTVRSELRKRKRQNEDVEHEDDSLMELDLMDCSASSMEGFTQGSHAIAKTISDAEKKFKIFLKFDFEAFKSQLLAICRSRSESQSYLKMIIMGTTKMAKQSVQTCVDRGKIIMRVLVDLALKKSKMPEDVMKDLTKIGGDCVKYFPAAVAYDVVMKVGLTPEKLDDGKFSESWFGLYRKCMITLFQGGNIEHEGDYISGIEIRSIFVNEMCRLNWNGPLGPTIVKILMELPSLYDDIHEEIGAIVFKFKSTINDMDEKRLYTVTQCMIEGIGKFQARALIKICDEYFKNGEYYNNTVQMAAIDSAKKEEFLGKIAYLFVDAARHCDSIQIEFSKIVRAATSDHSLIMSPFMTTVLMGLAGIDHLSAAIIEPIKSSILRHNHDWNLSVESRFYSQVTEVMAGAPRQEQMVPLGWTYLMNSKLDYVNGGLENLGTSLLGVDSLQKKYPGTSKVTKELGANMLISLVLKDKDSLVNMLKWLLKTDSPAHVECLAKCLSKCSRLLTQSAVQGRIGEVIHHIPTTNVSTASMIIKALMPAIQLSHVLLGELMIVVRKTFWKSVESGRISVEIMCVLMSNSKVVGSNDILARPANMEEDDLLLTQGSQSVPLVADVDFPPICSEMLNLTKRCLEQDLRVREQVYLGFHRVARRNPALCDLICGHLFSHASQYRFDESTISFKSLFSFSTTNMDEVKVKDELGFLVQCIGSVFNRLQCFLKQDEQVDKPVSFINCKNLLQEWIDSTISIKPDRIEIIASSLVEAAGTGRPATVARYVRDVIMMQTMQMIEALIEFIALADGWPDSKRKLTQLFKNLKELHAFSKEQASQKKTKTAGKRKPKKNTKKSVAADDTEVDDDVSIISGSDNSNQTAGKSKANPNPIPKLEYFHLMNLDSVCQMLRDLYKKETSSALYNVKASCDFEILLLNTVTFKLSKMKARQPIRERERSQEDSLNALTCLVETVWNHLLENTLQFKKNETMSEDLTVIQMRLEIVVLILQYFYDNRLRNRILYFTDHRINPTADPTKNEKEHFKTFENWKCILQMVETLFEGATEHGSADLFSVLNLWCKNVEFSSVHEKVLSWVWEYMNNDTDKSGTEELLVNAVEAFITSYVKYFEYPEPRIVTARKGVFQHSKPDERLPFQFGIFKIAKAVHIVLGDNDSERLTQRQRSWLITKEFSPKLYCTLTSFVSHQLELVSLLLGCMKSHHQYVGDENWSENIREKCIQMIYFLRFIVAELICTSFPAGPCGTEVLKMCTQFYTVVTYFTEYYMDLTSHANDVCLKHYKQFLGDIGREFKPKIECLIQYVEKIQREKCENAKGKAKFAKSQIAKDGKLVPNLVFRIEKFEQKLIVLNKKVKALYDIDLLTDMKLSTSRDFRIEGKKVIEVLKEKAAAENTNKTSGRRKKAVEVMEVDQDS